LVHAGVVGSVESHRLGARSLVLAEIRVGAACLSGSGCEHPGSCQGKDGGGPEERPHGQMHLSLGDDSGAVATDPSWTGDSAAWNRSDETFIVP
jgi:hypothetical protein